MKTTIPNIDELDTMCPPGKSYIPAIKENIVQGLHYYLSKHSKVFFTRFTLTFPIAYLCLPGYPYISRFIQKYSQFFSRNGYDPLYLWVREQNTSVHYHFHIGILVNGSLIQHPYLLTTKAEELWSNTLGVAATGLVNSDCSISIRRNEPNFIDQLQITMDYVMYLAKSYTKGPANDGVRNFGMSRLHKS